tara:strand:+ start:8418 stop:9560 length:1143 start_codon:yes stop_codon:yes gene_type:complete
MKVLHFTTTVGGGGAETMLCNVTEQLSSLGAENVVVSTTSSIGDNSLKDRIEETSVFYDLEVTSLLSGKFCRRFLAILKKEKPDIVQTWMHTSGAVAGALAVLTGIRHVVWGVHSKELLVSPSMSKLKQGALKTALRLSSKLVPEKIISCSMEGIAIHNRDLGYPNDKMLWIGNGIDTNRFTPDHSARDFWRNELSISEDEKVFGMVTRMNPVKDVPTFLRAIREFQTNGGNAHFVICGEGLDQAYPEIHECAADLPDATKLHWIDFQEKIESVYPLFDWLTLTSISEASPMALIEAMACGVPCISTDVGDARFIVDEAGFVIPPSSPTILAETWQNAIAVSELQYAGLSANARQLSEDRFKLQDCASRYFQVYSDLLAA